MTTSTHKQVVLASRPTGWVTADNFSVTTRPTPEPQDGEVLVRVIHASLDPYMRGRMNDVKSYVPPFKLGEVLTTGAVGEIVASRNDGFAEGDLVQGMLDLAEYSLSKGSGLTKVARGLAPLSSFLGVLGMPGFTAYVGLLRLGKPKPGDTVFVSAASGAVGSLVGQIAKIKECTAVGSAGSEAKVGYLVDELGFDAAYNYKKTEPRLAMRAACSNGIDINFENVGGDTLDAALAHMNPFGRIVFCGAISQYNAVEPPPGPRNLLAVIGKRLTIQGFIVSDHADLLPDFMRDVGGWLAAGKVKARETVVEGIDRAPGAFVGLFKGENFGKMIVRISDDP